MRLGVSERATALILVLVFAGFAACSAYIYRSQSAALRADVQTNMSALSTTAARAVGNWLSGKLDLTRLMAQQVTIAGTGSNTDDILNAPIAREAFVLNFFGRADGYYTKMPKSEIAAGYDPRQRPWYKGVVEANGPALTEPYVSSTSKQLTITASAPAASGTGGLIGVAGSDFDLGALSKMINEVETDGHGYAYLVSGAGKILIHLRAELIGKPLSELLGGSPPKIGGSPVETREGERATLTVFARVPNLPAALDWYVALSVDSAKAFAPVMHLFEIMVVATLAVLLVLAIVVSRMMAVTVARPLKRLVAALEQMAQGAVDAKIAEAGRHDEIGAVGRAVEGIRGMVARKALEEAERKQLTEEVAAAERKRTMIALADGFEAAVGGIVGLVSSSATELQATAQSMTATASETAVRSTGVAAAAEETATNVNTVAVAAEELGASVQEIARQVAGSANLAQTAVLEAEQSAHLVQELHEAVSQIDAVVGLISTIAGQTNLLALNATIEAARAGAAGKGFSVVAAEVKALADQTARATGEITGHIRRIQSSTGQAASAIDGIGTRIREIDGLATSIASAVEEQEAATQEIAHNVVQVARGTSEVTDNFASVARASEDTGAAASQVLASASELSRQSEHLAAEVGRFVARVRAA